MTFAELCFDIVLGIVRVSVCNEGNVFTQLEMKFDKLRANGGLLFLISGRVDEGTKETPLLPLIA